MTPAAALARVHRRPCCEAAIPSVCNGRAEHAHHRKMRSQRGATDLDNLIAVCHRCHWAIHNPSPGTAPRWSYAHGLLVAGWMDPAEVPVIAGHRLDCTEAHL